MTRIRGRDEVKAGSCSYRRRKTREGIYGKALIVDVVVAGSWDQGSRFTDSEAIRVIFLSPGSCEAWLAAGNEQATCSSSTG